ncbi:MAG: hypothetical protein MUC84_12735 [Solirubrobacteraceae bacterium]|jgi:hypothetical protein|nr:hypothetical protein [Solirubrobacteraceae bacterium]MCU0314909.1 hypothetical protein [Solirubrobacteraceae bacterium]
MVRSTTLNEGELERFAHRVGEHWPESRVIVGGARVDDARGVVPQRERGPEFVAVVVASAFEGVAWLERVHEAAALWDAEAMGAPAELHCYTPAEFERRRETLPVVRWAAGRGVTLAA